MIFYLNSDHTLNTNSNTIIGVGEENKSEEIIIQINYDDLLDKWAYIEFETEDGLKYTTEKLNIINRQIVYVAPNGIMKSGVLRVQMIFRGENSWVWKSFIKQVIVKQSINASKNIEKNYPDLIGNVEQRFEDVQQDIVDVNARVDNIINDPEIVEFKESVLETLDQQTESIADLGQTIINIAKQMQPKVYFGLDVFTQTPKSIISSSLTNSFVNVYNYYYGLDEDGQTKINYPFLIYNYRVDTYNTDKNNYMEASIKTNINNILSCVGYDEENNYYITVNMDTNLITYYYVPKLKVNDSTLIFRLK